MSIPPPELLNEIRKGMIDAAPDEWQRLELSLTSAGLMIKSGLSVTKSDGSVDKLHEIDGDTLAACDELRESMYQAGSGTWYNADIIVDRSGNIESTFDYENPPFDGTADPELLTEDQQEYPRDQEHLPNWHPAKA
jgi:hypothetical protein